MIIRRHLGRRRQFRGSHLFALLAFVWTGRLVDAQGNGGNRKTTTTTSDTQQTTTDQPQPTGDSNSNDSTTSQDTPSETASTASHTSSHATATLPNLFSSTSSADLPQLTSSAPLPNLTTALPKLIPNTSGIPTYQVVIPQLDGNPYLQTSSFPEGTVFIIVGSCLAGLALVLIFSRAIYIWCLHRQTKNHSKDIKYSEMEQRPYTAPGMSSNPFAGMSAPGTISLEYLRPGDRSSRVSTFSSRPSTARPQTTNSTLRPNSSINPLANSNVQYYSPSAHPNGTATATLGTQGSRNSECLPAGYYLREPSAPNNMRDPSPRQMYGAPTPNTTSFLYTDPSAPPVPRLTRSPTANSTGTLGTTTRPSTGGGSNGNGGGYAYTGQSYNPQTRARVPTGYGGDPAGGDRRSKPSQVLDEMLRG